MQWWYGARPAGKPTRVRAVVTLSVAALLCMLALVGHFLWQSRERAIEAAKLDTRNLVEAVGSRVSAEFRLLDSLLRHAAHGIPRHELDAAGMIRRDTAWARNLQSLAQAFPSAQQLFVFDAAGSMLYSSTDLAPFSIADRAHFQHLRDNPGVEAVFSRLHRTRPAGRWGLVQMRALRDAGGRFTGVVSAVLYLDGLSSVFGGIDVGSDGLTLLRSTQDSRLVLRVPRLNEQDFDQPLPPTNPIRQHIDAGARSGSLTYTATTDGVRRVASFRRLDEFPFYVQVAVAETRYLAAWRHQAAVSLALALLVMAAFGLVTMRLARAGGQADRALQQLQASEQRLRESRRLLQKVIDEAPVLIMLKDREGRFQMANAALARLLDTTPAAMVGRREVELVANADEAQAYARSDLAVLEGGVAQTVFEKFTDAAGEVHHYQAVKTPFALPGEQPGVLIISTDITELRRTQLRLQRSEERLSHALAATEDAIYDWQVVPDRVEHNARWAEMLGLDAVPPAHGLDAYAHLVHPEDREAARARIGDCLAGRGAMNFEYRMLRPDGRVIWVLNRGQVVERDAGGRALRMAGTLSDITARKEAEARLAQAASVFGHAREGIVITDAQMRVIDVNEAFTRLTGYARAEALGQSPSLLDSPRHEPAFFEALRDDLRRNGFWEGEIWHRGKSGREQAALTTITAVRDARGQVSHYVVLFSDITAAKETEAMLRRFAHFDALTGLPNRVLLADRLGQAMAGARRSREPLALAYVDLDGFKAINDRCGHEAGDHVLLVVAERMKECLRTSDTIARLGGDEFVAVLTGLDGEAAVLPVVERLLQTIARGVRYEGHELQVSGSIGVTFYPQPANIDADQLLRQADQAMYQAKLAGKNRHHVFDVRQHASLQGRYEQIERIRLALAQGEFELHFQPKVHMRSGRVLGAEALLRWRHPQRGLVPPLEFLPLVAQHPLDIDVGWWVVDTALAQMQAWAAQGLELPVSVNVTGFHLQQPQFLERLRQCLGRHADLPRGCLELEVLESSALHDIEQVSGVIAQCRQLGVDVALDDFGTGYSTLTHLRRLPVRELKIDRSFVQNMLHDAGDLAILEGIIGLARAFQRGLVAEGVESVAHGEALLRLGCEVGQGYGIARPMPGADVPAWVASWRPDAAWRRAPGAAPAAQAGQEACA
ncbi:bifunctional diguanylate cyclase/phosphodiesterase [Azohydromonas aeria]|uniref:bifunctional diguanylate cyclase/phosphodiesterase n=1 Tax=Azohydromonas aeria TaxID=2590212 RepID=UPI0018DFC4B7|nr:EAL domain-containing protein [Azohydromonas aeria]